MTATPPPTDPLHLSTKSQRRGTAANASADSPTSRRTPRATRSSKRSTGFEAKSVEGGKTPESPVKRKSIEADPPKTAKRKRIIKVEEAEIEIGEPSPKKTKHTKATETAGYEASPSKAKRKTKVKEEDEEVQEAEVGQKKIKHKRRTKEEKELEAMPLAVRTDGLRMFIGAHVSGAKGWLFSMYIASLDLRLVFISRSSQLSHKLRPHWVNNLQVSQIKRT